MWKDDQKSRRRNPFNWRYTEARDFWTIRSERALQEAEQQREEDDDEEVKG